MFILLVKDNPSGITTTKRAFNYENYQNAEEKERPFMKNI